MSYDVIQVIENGVVCKGCCVFQILTFHLTDVFLLFQVSFSNLVSVLPGNGQAKSSLIKRYFANTVSGAL